MSIVSDDNDYLEYLRQLKVVQILETAQRSLNNGGMKELIQW
jgi:hypothetical protein